MFILPMTGRMSWRNPPIITILIILCNCVIYFFIQADEYEKYKQAEKFYLDSGLATIETSRFVQHLQATGQDSKTIQGDDKSSSGPKALAILSRRMHRDHVFMKKLLAEEIISPGDPDHTRWKELRNQYAGLLSTVPTERYGYKSAGGSMLTVMTSLFLHGSFMHLLGNMLLLWLAGCTLELTGRRLVYIATYLVTGICATLLFGLVYRGSTTPLIGASGAISGLVGAFTVLYGRKPIKVFYSLGFYFNYTQVPAIAIFPVWLGNEAFQLAFGEASQVAYVAHIGGLISGAALGLMQRRLLGSVTRELLPEDRGKQIATLLEKALQQVSALDLPGARDLIMQVLALDSQNLKALQQLFHIDKLSPDQERLHETASRYLLSLSQDSHSQQTLYVAYQDYCRAVKTIRLPADLCIRLSAIFAQLGHLEDSAKLVALLLRTSPQSPAAPTALFRLAMAYQQAGVLNKGEKCLQLLIQRYPDSQEAKLARTSPKAGR